MIREERRHLRRRFEVSLRVRRKAPAGRREIGSVMDARENIEQRTFGRRRKADAVGHHGRHAKRRREIDEAIVGGFVVAAIVPLQLDVHRLAAEESDQPIDKAADAEALPVERRASGKRDQPARRSVELVERERPLALR
jgi:hypothetical protein